MTKTANQKFRKGRVEREKASIHNLVVTSGAFAPDGIIPVTYTCDGDDINPSLHIENIPQGTKSLVLIVDDPDAPMGVFDHWVVWNIPPSHNVIKENEVPGVEGLNDFGKHHYEGPCPPSGVHRYFFTVYALDKKLDIDQRSRSAKVKVAMKGHILAEGELVGLYSREHTHL